MKKLAVLSLVSLSFASAFALQASTSVKGFVEDTACSTKAGMKGDADCAKECIRKGSPAVLVTENGKVYKISNQKMIVEHAGESVTVTGTLNGDTITVDTVK